MFLVPPIGLMKQKVAGAAPSLPVTDQLIGHWDAELGVTEVTGPTDSTFFGDDTSGNTSALSILDASQTGLDGVGSGITISCWAYVLSGTGQITLIDKFTPPGGYRMYLNTNRTTLNFNATPTSFNTWTDSWNVGVAQVALNEWNHFAVTRDKATGENRGFLNGVQIGATAIRFAGEDLLTTTEEFQLGGAENINTDLHGHMAEAQVWSIALTPTQIADNYRKARIGNEANLEGYWSIHTDFNDLTANANHLTALAGGSVAAPVISSAVGNPFEDNVSVWADQSGAGNDWLKEDLGPVKVPAVLNGKSVMSFRNRNAMGQAAFRTFGNAGEMISVMRTRAAGTRQRGFHQFGGANFSTSLFMNSNNSIYDDFGSSFRQGPISHGGDFDQDEWGYYNPSKATSSGAFIMRTNGLERSNILISSGWSNGATYFLGESEDVSPNRYKFEGEIAEAVFYGKVLTFDERQLVYEYLDTKYGLLLAGPPQTSLVAHWDETGIQSGGDGTPLTGWTDNTGNGFDLVPGTTAPTHLVANLNGRDVVDCDTANGWMTLDVSGGAPISGSTSGTIYVVAITDSLTGVNGGSLIDVSSASGLGSHHPWTTGQVFHDIGSTVRRNFSWGINTGWHSWHSFSCSSAPGAHLFHSFASNGFNILGQYFTNTVSWSSGANDWAIGGPSPYQGRIAEVLIYDTEHDAGTKEAIHRHLAEKWGY